MGINDTGSGQMIPNAARTSKIDLDSVKTEMLAVFFTVFSKKKFYIMTSSWLTKTVQIKLCTPLGASSQSYRLSVVDGEYFLGLRGNKNFNKHYMKPE